MSFNLELEALTNQRDYEVGSSGDDTDGSFELGPINSEFPTPSPGPDESYFANGVNAEKPGVLKELLLVSTALGPIPCGSARVMCRLCSHPFAHS